MGASAHLRAAETPRLPKRRGLDLLLSLSLFIIALLAYLRTMRPTFGWGDSSELITAAYHLGVGHPPGYPTWMLIAYPFSHLPIGDVAFRVNFMNVLFGAVGVALLYLVYCTIARSRFAAFVAVLIFAFSATFWDVTTEADVFTLHICFAALIFLAALRWRRAPSDKWLYLLSWLVGVSLGNHALTALMVPALLYLVWSERGLRFFAHRRTLVGAGCLIAGLAIYLYVPIRSLDNPPPHLNNTHNLGQFWLQITAPGARQAMFDDGLGIALVRAKDYLVRLKPEFGLAGCLLALVGLGLLWKRDRRLTVFLVAIAALAVAYACNFSIFDIYTYYLPLHIVWGALIGVGAAAALELSSCAIAKLKTGARELASNWRMLPVAALLLALPAGQFDAHLSLADGSEDFGSERFARAVFQQVEPGAMILADWWTIAPLGYLKYVEGQRPDVTMFAAPSIYSVSEGGLADFVKPEFLQAYPAVYFVEMLTYRANLVRELCFLVPEGPIARVVAKRPDPETLLADVPPIPMVRFGDSAALVRTEVEPGKLRAGECLDFILYWTPLAGYTGQPHQAILVLENEEDGRIWQESNILGHNLYPLEQWRPGQVLLEKHRIYLPDPVPPGCYGLFVRVREHGQAACLECDRSMPGHGSRDYCIAHIAVADPEPLSTRDRIPTLVALLRP